MSYEVFESSKDIKTVRKKDDVEFFQKAMKNLKFERDVDLVVFCASIGLYRSKLKNLEIKENNPSLKKLTSITTFDKSRLFDFIILTYLNTEHERMKEFENYFYTGFTILKKWFDENDKNMTNTIERIYNLTNDLIINK